MAASGEISKAVEVGVYQDIVDRFLQPYWGMIAGKGADGQDPPLPAADEFERMAKELVDSRDATAGPQFTLPVSNGGRVVRVNEVKKRLVDLAGTSGAAGVVAGFDATGDIPSRYQVRRLAAAVERGVTGGSGWWNVFCADPLGTLIDLVVGFFTGTLRQRMGERFAQSTSVAVQQELAALRQQPGMATLLTTERVIAIGERVAEETRRAVSSSGAQAPTSVRLRADVQPLAGAILFRPYIEASIRSLVSDAFRARNPVSGQSARDALMAGRRSFWTLGLVAHGALKAHEADAVENRVAGAFVKVATDKDYRFNGKTTYELSDAELKAAVVAQVGIEIRKLHQERGWSYAKERTGTIVEMLQERLTTEQVGKLRQASALVSGRGLATMMPTEAKEAVRQERRNQNDHGISGASEASARSAGSARVLPNVPSWPRTISTQNQSLEKC